MMIFLLWEKLAALAKVIKFNDYMIIHKTQNQEMMLEAFQILQKVLYRGYWERMRDNLEMLRGFNPGNLWIVNEAF